MEVAEQHAKEAIGDLNELQERFDHRVRAARALEPELAALDADERRFEQYLGGGGGGGSGASGRSARFADGRGYILIEGPRGNSTCLEKAPAS